MTSLTDNLHKQLIVNHLLCIVCNVSLTNIRILAVPTKWICYTATKDHLLNHAVRNLHVCSVLTV
jgi:hypothetical protein